MRPSRGTEIPQRPPRGLQHHGVGEIAADGYALLQRDTRTCHRVRCAAQRAFELERASAAEREYGESGMIRARERDEKSLQLDGHALRPDAILLAFPRPARPPAELVQKRGAKRRKLATDGAVA